MGISKEEKKWRKIIKKNAKKKAKKKAKKAYDNNWNKYEPAGCFACNRGQLYRGGKHELSVTYYDRCKCANIKTEKYKKFRKDRKKMNYADALIMGMKFFDNNSHISEGNNSEPRSW